MWLTACVIPSPLYLIRSFPALQPESGLLNLFSENQYYYILWAQFRQHREQPRRSPLISKALGHSSTNTTTQVYMHLFDETHLAVVQKVGRAIGDGESRV